MDACGIGLPPALRATPLINAGGKGAQKARMFQNILYLITYIFYLKD